MCHIFWYVKYCQALSLPTKSSTTNIATAKQYHDFEYRLCQWVRMGFVTQNIEANAGDCLLLMQENLPGQDSNLLFYSVKEQNCTTWLTERIVRTESRCVSWLCCRGLVLLSFTWGEWDQVMARERFTFQYKMHCCIISSLSIHIWYLNVFLTIFLVLFDIL